MAELSADIYKNVEQAVRIFWETRLQQSEKQRTSGRADQGFRSAVTGGAQMNGFIKLITDLIKDAGINESEIFFEKFLELPGYFRPTKKWDLLVVKNSQLILALEAKSQVGPSFGNNFNNRTEEAMGSAMDLWTAYREGVFKISQPWLGYLFLLEDCPESNSPVKAGEPHFPIMDEFRNASYAKRYEIFCRKLVRERQYNSAAFLMSGKEEGLSGKFKEPAEDLRFIEFARALMAHVGAYSV